MIILFKEKKLSIRDFKNIQYTNSEFGLGLSMMAITILAVLGSNKIKKIKIVVNCDFFPPNFLHNYTLNTIH